ncbi:hypothetical protein C8Q75DRAFT_785964 [Abortiporus biennis]|nr:hypothetical protein C8Q75DRAFT_785964 [Abortiporus biennis]
MSFPAEIVESIISHIASDKALLRTASLVSYTWLVWSRRYYFRTLVITITKETNDIETILNFIRDSQFMREYVYNLRLVYNKSHRTGKSLEFSFSDTLIVVHAGHLSRFLKYFSNLEDLEMHRMHLGPVPKDLRLSTRDLPGSGQSSSTSGNRRRFSLGRLSISEVTFYHYGETMIEIIAQFSIIGEMKIDTPHHGPDPFEAERDLVDYFVLSSASGLPPTQISSIHIISRGNVRTSDRGHISEVLRDNGSASFLRSMKVLCGEYVDLLKIGRLIKSSGLTLEKCHLAIPERILVQRQVQLFSKDKWDEVLHLSDAVNLWSFTIRSWPPMTSGFVNSDFPPPLPVVNTIVRILATIPPSPSSATSTTSSSSIPQTKLREIVIHLPSFGVSFQHIHMYDWTNYVKVFNTFVNGGSLEEVRFCFAPSWIAPTENHAENGAHLEEEKDDWTHVERPLNTCQTFCQGMFRKLNEDGILRVCCVRENMTM